MEDIDGGLHPAVDGQSLDQDEDDEMYGGNHKTSISLCYLVEKPTRRYLIPACICVNRHHHHTRLFVYEKACGVTQTTQQGRPPPLSWDAHRLVGLVVKASVSRAEDPEFKSRLRQDFFGVESYQ